MPKEKKVQISQLPKTSSLGDEDVVVIEQKINSKYITRSTTLSAMGDYFGAGSGGGGGGGGGPVSADKVSYDNSISELDATNVQTAIDVLAEKLRDYSGLGLASLEVPLQAAAIEEVRDVPEN